MSDLLGIKRGSAFIPRAEDCYRGPIKIHGHAYEVVMVRDGDGVRLSVHDGPPLTVPTTGEWAVPGLDDAL